MNRQRLPLRETPRLAVSEGEPVGVAMPRVERAMLPIRPSISATAEPSGMSAPMMPARAKVAALELPQAPVVSVPSPARAGTFASTPSFVSAASDRTGGVAADADALKTLVDMFAGLESRAALDSVPERTESGRKRGQHRSGRTDDRARPSSAQRSDHPGGLPRAGSNEP
jgi:hypothetical protein